MFLTSKTIYLFLLRRNIQKQKLAWLLIQQPVEGQVRPRLLERSSHYCTESIPGKTKARRDGNTEGSSISCRQRMTNSREKWKPSASKLRQSLDRTSRVAANADRNIFWLKVAFSYDSTKDYASKRNVSIDRKETVYKYFRAIKWPVEAPARLLKRKLRLDASQAPSDILMQLLTDDTLKSKNFRDTI